MTTLNTLRPSVGAVKPRKRVGLAQGMAKLPHVATRG